MFSHVRLKKDKSLVVSAQIGHSNDLRLTNKLTFMQKCRMHAIITAKWKIWWLAPQMSNLPGKNLSGILAT